MATTEIITKRLAITKTNSQMILAVGIASFITVFCLIAANAVLSQTSYQGRVLKAQNLAKNQLQTNLDTYSSLSSQYNKFVDSNPNVLGGQISSSGDNGGNNSKLILDALPPTYDFPALATSVDGILSGQGVEISSIGGTDDELGEQANTSSASPAPVIMPFTFSSNSINYQGIANILNILQTSIRPIAVDSISIASNGSTMNLTVTAHTYYQPAKSIGITEQEVK